MSKVSISSNKGAIITQSPTSSDAGVVWPLTRYHLCSVKIVLVCFFDRYGAKVSQCRYSSTERSPREESTVVRQARVQKLLGALRLATNESFGCVCSST